jgi:hypothetical protein
MKISTDFKSFNAATMILVTSRQDAIAYIAEDRELIKVFELHTKKPEYTDDEGHFERSGNGRTYGQGSTEKEIDDIAYEEFTAELCNKVNDHDQDFDKLILFAPDQYKNSTKDCFATQVQNKIIAIHSGNIVHEHPTDILARLNE